MSLTFIRSIWEAILDVFFPEPIDWRGHEQWLRLLRSMPRTGEIGIVGNLTEDAIVWGGRPLHGQDIGSAARRRIERQLERAATLLWYDAGGVVQTLLKRSKFGRGAEPEILWRLGQEAAAELMNSDFLETIDLIVPVPLHPKRLRERGFNQSEVIAQAISRATGIPLDTQHLVRNINNEHQARLGASERVHNTMGVFCLNQADDFQHKHILLVDDIITTGSTIRGCFRALQSARHCRISVFALAKAR